MIKKNNKVIITFIVVFMALLMGISLWQKQISIFFKSSPKGSSEVLIRKGTLQTTSTRIVLESCGTNLSQYKYSVEIPQNWDVVKRNSSEYSVYYDTGKDNVKFTIGCTTQGVGGGLCDEQEKVTKFVVLNKTYETCFSQDDGVNMMSVLNIDTDPKTNATIGFWSEGIELDTLRKILTSFRYQ